jgi:hypothetical protein
MEDVKYMRKGNLISTVKENKLVKRGSIFVMVAALAAGSWYGVGQVTQYEVPELTTTIDEPTVATEDEEVPLAASKSTTTTKTNTKKTKKTVKLSKASTKTYKITKPTKTKKTTKTTKGKKQTVKVETTTVTSVVENYTKKSKNKVITTQVKTTTKTTTTPVATQTSTSKASTSAKSTAVSAKVQSAQTYSIEQLAPKADKSLLKAYSTLKFDVTVNPSVSYSGYFDSKAQNITLKTKDDTIYHELGHFLAFLAGNVDTKSDFVSIYDDEKNSYTGVNKAYATQSSSEYFAESYKDYVLNNASLKSARPQTYEAITQALATVTDSHVQRVQTVYRSVWKK